MKSLSAQFGKANDSDFTDVMGRNIWDKSWSGRGDNKNDSMDSMKKVDEYFSESNSNTKISSKSRNELRNRCSFTG